MTAQRIFDWENTYKSNKMTDLPWYNPNLEIDLQNALQKLGLKSGTFLDLGTGPATQAKKLQEIGFEVTGVDISAEAILLWLNKLIKTSNLSRMIFFRLN